MPSLEFDVDGSLKRIEIDRPGIIGRDPRVEYVIEHPTISRRHAQLHLGDDSVVVVDLASANGTKVNEEPLTGPRRLNDGDWIEIGRLMARFRAEAKPVVSVPSTMTTLDSPPTETGDDGSTNPMGVAAAPDPLVARLMAKDDLVDDLFKLLDDDSVRAGLGQALVSLRRSTPGISFAAVVDRVSAEYYAVQPDAGARNPAMLQQAFVAIEVEGGARLYAAQERETLAGMFGLQPVPGFMLVVDLGSVIGKPLVLYVDGPAPLDELGEANLLMVARALRAVTRHFDSSRIAAISDEDLKLAQRIQRRLLKSQPPAVPRYKIAQSYTPALAVGGDFYDLQITPNGELAIVIGDVSGKGVSASLYMAQIMAALRQFVPEAKGPGELLTTINAWLAPVMEPGLFATMAACFLDPRKHSCRLAQAGHAPPVLRTIAKKVIEMSSEPGMPLGAMAELKPKEQKLVLTPGDLLLFTTDGVEEGENTLGEAYGTTRRDAALKSAQGALAVTLSVRESLLNFVGNSVSTDDMTIIAVEREE